MRSALLTCMLLIAFKNVNAQLVINEISQGSGSQEYVELIVMGDRACIAPIPTVDLRGIIIDDNNGYFNTGAGTGIASGAVQFALIPFWSAIPQGTIIVIYNNTDVAPNLPPMDVSMNDGNCRLVIPVNSTLFNGQSSLPNTTDPTYPPQATWINGGGSWTQISMNNSNDSFQIRASITSTTPSYSVSWGNNNALGNQQVYDLFGGSDVFSNTMSVDTDPLNNANWYATAGPGTPGAPNTTQNQTYLGITNPECYGSSLPVFDFDVTPTACGTSCTGAIAVSVSGGSPFYYYAWSTGQNTSTVTDLCAGNIAVTITDDYGCTLVFDTVVPQNSNLLPQALVSNETCSGECDGGAVASAMGGTPPYSYSWSDSFNGANNQDLCPGLYILTVTDQNGCSGTLNITVNSGTAITNPTMDNPGTHQESEGTIQLTASPAGGTWSSSCGSCISPNGVFNTAISGSGTFDVCYTITSGNCSSTNCQTITIEAPCQDTYLTLSGNLCEGDTLTVNGIDYTSIGTYTQTIPLANGCDSILTLVLVQCLDGDDEIQIPNVLTPNGDQVNDIWFVSTENVSLMEGFIVNRWGEVVKTFVDNTIEWDGKLNQIDVSDGVYFYRLTLYSTAVGEFSKQGFIHVFH